LPFGDVEAVVRAGLGTRYSAAVVRIDTGGKLRWCQAYGTVSAQRDAAPVYVDTRFDLASLTKIFVSTVALALAGEGRLPLDSGLTGLVPEWCDTAHATITPRMILAHTAGFRSGADYRTLLDADVDAFALREPLVGRPGRTVVYSDLGFIALGTVLARSGRASLARVVGSRLHGYGARNLGFGVPAAERARVAATECEAWRGLVQGAVHDEKAFLMNGVAGHAGLFGDAAAVARAAQWYLGPLHGRPSPLDPDLARAAVREAAFDPVLRRGLGWALKTTGANSCGTRMSAASFGHTGFTGTSVWADPERDASIVLLTNAVHFGRGDLAPVRAAVCDAAIAALDAA
jgi:CubicO group peptidase (beta-lactamase class C family)